ncbi:hypothetical protein D3C86_1704560 [compost metagenome]
MGVKAPQHIAHHARALDRPGHGIARMAQAHAVHGVENAPLHGLEAVADIGQGPALDHRQRVLEVGALGIGSEVQRIAIGLRRQIQSILIAHCSRFSSNDSRALPEGSVMRMREDRSPGAPAAAAVAAGAPATGASGWSWRYNASTVFT